MKLNLKLLKRLYLIDHASGEEHDMISFIINYCKKIPNITITIGKENNLFITKNTTNPESYVCIIAHMDTVHSFSSARELIINNNIITARYISSGLSCGLNADDCNGILVALQMLEVQPNLKVCFTTKEEIGGIGASEASFNYDFFVDVQCLLQADRRGNSDLIIHTNGITVASDDFLDDIYLETVKYGYQKGYGTFTDIGILTKDLGICSVNISCGYYNEHTVNESCNINDLRNCLNFVNSIINTIKLKQKFYYITISDFESENIKYNSAIPCDYCENWDCMHCKYVNG